LASKLSALLLLAAVSATGADLGPRPNEIFPLLVAAPRRATPSASYYRLGGRDLSDLALGGALGLRRWRTGEEQDWLWEADVEGLAQSRWKFGGGLNELEAYDLIATLPVTTRRGDVSFKGELFHENSHLGDDYVRRTGDAGFRSSREGLRALAALEPRRFARLYAGAAYLVHDASPEKRWTLQSGLELTTDDLLLFPARPTSLYLAEDAQWHQSVGWNGDSHTVAGIRVALPPSATRALRLQVGYFAGHSPYGQFFARREHAFDIAGSIEF
jgi:hypothetical protein